MVQLRLAAWAEVQTPAGEGLLEPLVSLSLLCFYSLGIPLLGMQAEQHQEEEEEGEEEKEGSGGGCEPEGAFRKNPFQLTVEDVYDISYVLGRELHKISSEPRGEMAAKVAHLQFKVVSVLEMLEALVNESNLTVEALKMERDSLKREVEELRKQGSHSAAEEVSLGPNKMVVDLTDANRPRFTLQELREVLQERNHLKAQLMVVQEELQCYKSGLMSQKQHPIEPTHKEPAVGSASGSSTGSEEKTIVKRLFAFKRPR
ncbi:RILP-like protein 2 [Eublepharis macularius]|uniref:RILP-like protein 2 n=1 Tax=Eublepharis macularius TaxID=481883 RepID=A0AA97LER4_EUBMA|nr:RILP-like protein 2 [Eublepharis macularius]